MKLAKMSLAAALLLGVNAYAIDNVKVNGDVKVNYQTVDSDVTGAADLFDKEASAADVALHLGLTADLSEGVSAGISMTAVSTLGIENNLVANTWSGAHEGTLNPTSDIQADDAQWVDEAWIAGTAGKTTAKLGRQSLDTPLVFTETWGIDKNTFEAAVLLNQDIADTTIVAAYVGKSNGTDISTVATPANDLGIAGYVNVGGKFDSFYNGAYTIGAINNSLEALTAQAWYYDVQGIAKAYWLQADVNMEGILFGAQYSSIDVDGSADDDTAYAVMLGYAMKDTVTIKAAYSSVDDKGSTIGNVANLATNGGGTQQTKLYTEMWWNYGQVGATGSDSFAISAEGTVSDIDLFAAYYMSEQDTAGNDTDVNEIALTATKSYGPLDTTVAILHDDIDREVGVDQKDLTLQVYLTYNF